MPLDESWFTEICETDGSAFSLKIKQKLHEEQSEFQKIEIFETEKFGNLMVIDGCTMVSTRDNFVYHEMMSHPVLYAHPAPKRVLIIGGGDCGTLREVLKHPEVELVHQIDIDERVTRLSEIYFSELCESNDDPRAELMFIDGIKWVNDAAEDSYDIIIIDSTDPVGPAEGLFSRKFYSQCFRILGENGLVAQQSESPLLHMDIIKGMYQEIQEAGFIDTATLFFPQCIYPSGWWSATMACKDNALSGFRQEDAENKPFETQYYNASVHQAALSAPEFFYPKLTE
ncbi:MAG: polyamine aminopropyltransferase [Gammaproteobacteria bacterium]|nr:polyamine aminopropyltransferase [Gammaproteobacteria bacterium]